MLEYDNMIYIREGRMSKLNCKDKKCEEAVRILKALAHPVRLAMIRHLMEGKCNVSNLEKLVEFSQSGVSQHLRILRLSNIIEPVREGKEICYKITDQKALQVVKLFLD